MNNRIVQKTDCKDMKTLRLMITGYNLTFFLLSGKTES